MRFQLRMHGWPFDQYCVPEGTIIDASSNDQWSKMIVARNLHLHPPINAQPLDQAAYDAMRSRHCNRRRSSPLIPQSTGGNTDAKNCNFNQRRTQMSHKPAGGLHSRNVSHVSAPKQEPQPHRASPVGAAQMGTATAYPKDPVIQGKGYANPVGPTSLSVTGPGGGRTIHPSGGQHGLTTRPMPEGKDILSEFGPEMSGRRR